MRNSTMPAGNNTLLFFCAIDEIEIENIVLTRESFIIKFFTPWLLRVALSIEGI